MENCKAMVREKDGWLRYFPCKHKPWKDGYCKQHHHDTVRVKIEESNLRYEEMKERKHGIS